MTGAATCIKVTKIPLILFMFSILSTKHRQYFSCLSILVGFHHYIYRESCDQISASHFTNRSHVPCLITEETSTWVASDFPVWWPFLFACWQIVINQDRNGLRCRTTMKLILENLDDFSLPPMCNQFVHYAITSFVLLCVFFLPGCFVLWTL